MSSFDVTDLPSPENRTAKDWVTYYLRLENLIAQGQSVQIGDNRVNHHDLENIQKQKLYWERKAVDDSIAAAGRPKHAPVYIV